MLLDTDEGSRWQEADIDLDVHFKRLRFLLFDPQDYLSISALLASPKLEPLTP